MIRARRAVDFPLRAILFWACFGLSIHAAQVPAVLTASAAAKEAGKFSSKHNFPLTATGLQFYHGRLYAGSNIGLLEFDRGVLQRAYQWNKSDSVVESPWLDEVNNLLWLEADGIGAWVNFDGTGWHRIPFPEPKNHTLTRGDVLSASRAGANGTDFWIEGSGGFAWRWHPGDRAWVEEDYPPVPFPVYNRFLRLVPVTGWPFYVIRGERDKVYQRKSDGTWQEIPNLSGVNFLVDQTTAVNEHGYLLTKEGAIMEVTRDGIKELKAPDCCEAFTRTSQGTLLAAFREGGIYEYKNGWQLVCQIPVGHDGEHWVHLAEEKGAVAYATAPIPRLVAKGDDYKTVYDSAATLWFFQEGKLQKIVWPPVAPVKLKD